MDLGIPSREYSHMYWHFFLYPTFEKARHTSKDNIVDWRRIFDKLLHMRANFPDNQRTYYFNEGNHPRLWKYFGIIPNSALYRINCRRSIFWIALCSHCFTLPKKNHLWRHFSRHHNDYLLLQHLFDCIVQCSKSIRNSRNRCLRFVHECLWKDLHHRISQRLCQHILELYCLCCINQYILDCWC